MTNLLIETLEYFFEHGVTENDIVEVIITYKSDVSVSHLKIYR